MHFSVSLHVPTPTFLKVTACVWQEEYDVFGFLDQCSQESIAKAITWLMYHYLLIGSVAQHT